MRRAGGHTHEEDRASSSSPHHGRGSCRIRYAPPLRRQPRKRKARRRAASLGAPTPSIAPVRQGYLCFTRSTHSLQPRSRSAQRCARSPSPHAPSRGAPAPALPGLRRRYACAATRNPGCGGGAMRHHTHRRNETFRAAHDHASGHSERAGIPYSPRRAAHRCRQSRRRASRAPPGSRAPAASGITIAASECLASRRAAPRGTAACAVGLDARRPALALPPLPASRSQAVSASPLSSSRAPAPPLAPPGFTRAARLSRSRRFRHDDRRK